MNAAGAKARGVPSPGSSASAASLVPPAGAASAAAGGGGGGGGPAAGGPNPASAGGAAGGGGTSSSQQLSAGALWTNLFRLDMIESSYYKDMGDAAAPASDTGVLSDAEKPGLIQAILESRALVGAGVVTNGVTVGLAKELALSIISACPFDRLLQARLFVLEAGLHSASSAEAAPPKAYRPRPTGRIREQDYSMDLGLALMHATIKNVSPKQDGLPRTLIERLNKTLTAIEPNTLFQDWAPAPSYEVPIAGQRVVVTYVRSSTHSFSPNLVCYRGVIAGSPSAVTDGLGPLTTCTLGSVSSIVTYLDPPQSVTSVLVRFAPGSAAQSVHVVGTRSGSVVADVQQSLDVAAREARVLLRADQVDSIAIHLKASATIQVWDAAVLVPSLSAAGLKPLLWDLTGWLAAAATNASLRRAALDALARLVMSAGSLACLIRFAACLLESLLQTSLPNICPTQDVTSKLWHSVTGGFSDPPNDGVSYGLGLLQAAHNSLAGAASASRNVPSASQLAVSYVRAGALEAPWCLELSPDTIQAIAELLERFKDSREDTAVAVIRAVLDILAANLRQLVAVDVDPVTLRATRAMDNEDGAGPLDRLSLCLLNIARRSQPESGPACDTLRVFMPIFFRASPDAMTSGLSVLLQDFSDGRITSAMPAAALMHAMLQHISGANAQDFLRLPPTGAFSITYCTHPARSTVCKQIGMLLSSAGLPQLGGGATSDVGQFAVPLLLSYQRQLFALARACSSDTWGPCVALADYAHQTLTRCCMIMEHVPTLRVDSRDAAVRLEGQLRDSVAGVLCAELIAGLCMMWRHQFVSDSLLPVLTRLLRAVDAAVIMMHGGSLAITGEPLANVAITDYTTKTAILDIEHNISTFFNRRSQDLTANFTSLTYGPWLLELEGSLGWLTARLAGLLISGASLSANESALVSWLSTPLMSAGIDMADVLPKEAQEALARAEKAGSDASIDWAGTSQRHVLMSAWDPEVYTKISASEWAELEQKTGAASDVVTADSSEELQAFIRRLVQNKYEQADTFLGWLNHHHPITGANKQAVKVVRIIELPCVVAMLKHTGLWREANSVLNSLATGQSKASVRPSEDMDTMFKEITKMRKWLRIAQQQKIAAATEEDGESKTPAPADKDTKHDDEDGQAAAFKQLSSEICARAKFLVGLSPAAPAGSVAQLTTVLSELAEAQEDQQIEEQMASEGGFVNENSLISKALRNSNWRGAPSGIPQVDGADALEMSDNPITNVCIACLHYLQFGGGVPPEVLSPVMTLRRRRAQSRKRGMYAMQALLDAVKLPTILASTIQQIRPAMRGALAPSVAAEPSADQSVPEQFGTVESKTEEDADQHSVPPGGQTRRRSSSAASDLLGSSAPTATQSADGVLAQQRSRALADVFGRHHPLQNLEGCASSEQQMVRQAFYRVYNQLAQLLAANANCTSASTPEAWESRLVRCVLWAWALDYQPADFPFLRSTPFLATLRSIVAITTRKQDASALLNAPTPIKAPAGDVCHPWSWQRVHYGLLSGTLPKRELVAHMQQVSSTPRYASKLPASWWQQQGLTGPLHGIVPKLSVSRLLEIYDSFVEKCFEMDLSDSASAQLPSAVSKVQAWLRNGRARPGVDSAEGGSRRRRGDDPPETLLEDERARNAALAVASATAFCEDKYGGLFAGTGLPPGVRRAAWSLLRLISVHACGGVRVVSMDAAQRAAADEEDFSAELPPEASPTSRDSLIERAASDLQQLMVTLCITELQQGCQEVISGSSVLEPMELEVRLFDILSHLLVLCYTGVPKTLFVRAPSFLATVARLLVPRSVTQQSVDGMAGVVSPRCSRLVLRLVVLLGSVVSPATLSTELSLAARLEGRHERIGFVNMLLGRIGLSLAMTQSESFSSTWTAPCYFGKGRVQQSLAMESLNTLRDLCASSPTWSRVIRTCSLDCLGRLVAALRKLGLRGRLVKAQMDSVLANSDMRLADVSRAVGAMCLLTGPPEGIRVGGSVRLVNSNAVGIVVHIGRHMGSVVIAAKEPSAQLDPSTHGADAQNRLALAAAGQFLDVEDNRVVVSFDGTLEHVFIRDVVPVPSEENHWLAADIIHDADVREGEAGPTIAGDFNSEIGRLVDAWSTLLSLGVSSTATHIVDPNDDTKQFTAGIENSGVGSWLVVLKLFALRVLPQVLTVPAFSIRALSCGLLQRLFVAALEPLRVPSLVPLQHLEAQIVTLQRWLLEDAQSNAAALLTPPVTDAQQSMYAAREAAHTALAALETNGDTSLADRRQQFARNLSDAVGRPEGLCDQALALHGDNQEAAIMWLLKQPNDAWNDNFEGAMGVPSPPERGVWRCTTCTFENAMSRTACDMCNTERPVALVKAPSRLPSSLELEMQASRWLSDEAAMEGISAGAALMPEVTGPGVPLDRGGSFRLLSGPDEGAPDEARVVGPVATGSSSQTWLSAGISLEDVCLVGSEDRREAMWVGMAVVLGVSQHSQSVAADEARFGVVVTNDESLRISYMDEETGACLDVACNKKLFVLEPKSIAGVAVTHVEALRSVAAATYGALTTHYSRRAIVALINCWPKASSITPSLEVLGGTQQLISLVKLVAAAENELGIERTDQVSQPDKDKSSTMIALRTLLRKLLVQEVQQARDEQATQEAADRRAQESAVFWSCPACTLHNALSLTTCALCACPKPAKTTAVARPRLKPGPLGLALARECERSIAASTEVDGGGDARTIECLHPYPRSVNYVEKVHFRGASALRVMFDPRCAVGSGTTVRFHTDESLMTGLLRKLANGSPIDYTPFVIQGDTVYIAVTTSSSEPAWGFRVVISPIWKLHWLREEQVLTSPSLEWGCWLMRFLMNEAQEVADTGALHDPRIFYSLVRYLRSSAVPYKDVVIDLIAQILSTPHLFDPSNPPDLETLSGLEELVMQRCRAEQSASHLFLPQRLMQLVQLTLLGRAAKRSDALLRVDPQGTGDLDPPFQMVSMLPLSDQPLEAILTDVNDLTNSLVRGTRVPDRLMRGVYELATGDATPRVDVIVKAERSLFAWDVAQDEQLVEFLVKTAASNDLTPINVPVRTVNLTADDKRQYPVLSNQELPAIRLRAALLIMFNERLGKVFSFIDLSAADEDVFEASSASRPSDTEWSIGSKLRKVAHCVFTASKLPLLQLAIDKTEFPTRLPLVRLHRGRAILSKDRKQITPSTSECLFVQGFRQLHDKPAACLRAPLDEVKEFLFPVKFMVFNARGQDEEEAGIDYGGLYREAVSTMVDDLFDPETFTLMTRVPNAVHHTGGNQDMFVPNSKYTSPTAIAMFEFVGKLMGISLRTKNFMPFRFPSIIWKQLVGQRVTPADLEAIDSLFYQYLNQVKDAVAESGPSGVFFTIPRCDGQVVPLRPGGARQMVTKENYDEFYRLAEQLRLREFRSQCAAMVRGLSQLVPLRAIRMLTWRELEIQACGVADVDVELMRHHSRYVKYTADDPVIHRFWNVLRSFTQDERVLFLKFCWGRTRLPAPGRWGTTREFKLSRQMKMGTNDDTLPCAHTCFFEVELPPYSSEVIMKKRLLTAMHFSTGYTGFG